MKSVAFAFQSTLFEEKSGTEVTSFATPSLASTELAQSSPVKIAPGDTAWNLAFDANFDMGAPSFR
jgi:hypothetical protein